LLNLFILFYSPRIRLESAVQNPLAGVHPAQGSKAHGSGGGIFSMKHATLPEGTQI